ncbi:MAG: hypothetical protein ACK4MV_05755 [Beijerinckiaceae bacterium]
MSADDDLRLLDRAATKGNVAARWLIRRLIRCKPHDPCNSGACARCVAKWNTDLTELLVELASGQEVTFVSLVDPESQARPGHLHQFDHNNHKRRVKWLLREAQFDWGLFVTDFSFNEHQQGRYQPFWAPHHHGPVVGANLDDLKAYLRKHCKATDEVPRPWSADPWDGNPDAFRYILGVEFDRRIGRDDAVCVDGRTGKLRSPHRNVRHDELRVGERLELLLHLHEIGIPARITVLRAQLRAASGDLSLLPLRQPAS